MRKHWIDNLRWTTLLLVLLYHVIYYYNNKGVFGGIGGFGEFPQVQQYQDVLMYMVYPWFMPLLFILAGVSARYALQNKTGKEWFRARTRKLLVPGTIGLDSAYGVRRCFWNGSHHYHMGREQYVGGVYGYPSEQPLRLADVPCHDGLVCPSL